MFSQARVLRPGSFTSKQTARCETCAQGQQPALNYEFSSVHVYLGILHMALARVLLLVTQGHVVKRNPRALPFQRHYASFTGSTLFGQSFRPPLSGHELFDPIGRMRPDPDCIWSAEMAQMGNLALSDPRR